MGPNAEFTSVKTVCRGCQNEITIAIAHVEKELNCTICGEFIHPAEHASLMRAIEHVRKARREKDRQQADERRRRKKQKELERAATQRDRELKEQQRALQKSQSRKEQQRWRRLRTISKRMNTGHSRVGAVIVALILLGMSVVMIFASAMVFSGAETIMQEIVGTLLLVVASVVGCTGIVIILISETIAVIVRKFDAVCDLLRWQGGLAEDEAEAEALRGRVD